MSASNLLSELLAKATEAIFVKTGYTIANLKKYPAVYQRRWDECEVRAIAALIAADVPGLLAECDALRAALAAVVADYTSLLRSEYQTHNNPDPAADVDSIREARRLLEGKEIR